MFLFLPNRKGSVALHKDVMQLCPFFAELTEDELLYTILSTDYYSPYRQLNQEERYRRANAHVFKNQEKQPWLFPKIAKAIKEYEALQFDVRREQLKTYQSKILKINEAIRGEDSATVITSLIKTNEIFRKEVEKIEKELSMQEEQEAVQLLGKGQLSLLEKLSRNKEDYKERYDNPVKKQDVLPQVYANRNYNEPEPSPEDNMVDLEDLTSD